MATLQELLEPEQIQLFKELAEAYFAVSRPKRDRFMVLYERGNAHIQGNKVLRNDVLWDDMVTLADQELFQYESMSNAKGFNCVISPRGRLFYNELMAVGDQQTEQIEDHVWRYFDSQAFQRSYPTTFAKWHEASNAVWSSESGRDFAAIGFTCREAMQVFVTELVDKYRVEGVNPDPASTRERFSAVLNKRREELGEKKSDLLDALFVYWREAGKLVQRQVHGNERQEDDLVWDDGRRVVFQLGFVMFEAARTLEG